MPYGLKRFQKAEALHFITFSCHHRLPFLDAPDPKNIVEAVLEQTRARHQARVYAYVLMPEHVHLLINEPPSILVAQFLKAVKQITSRKLRAEREKFWQERYFDRNVHGEDARSEVIRYIHRNPVKRGLVASPERLPMEQLQPLRDRRSRSGRNRIGVDSKPSRPTHRDRAAMNGAQPSTSANDQRKQNRCLGHLAVAHRPLELRNGGGRGRRPLPLHEPYAGSGMQFPISLVAAACATVRLL